MECKELLSVIVPVHNVAGYLERCVNSILAQTYSNLQIILVDDGSTDGSEKICDLMAEQDERIMVIHKPNGGLSDARNVGISYATGSFIAFLDSDDYIHHQMYQELIHQMDVHDADIAECNYIKTIKTRTDLPYRGCVVQIADRNQALISMMRWECFDISVWNKVYKRELLDGLFFPIRKICEDEFWTYQVFFRAKKLLHLEYTFHYYQQARADSILTKGFTEKNYASTEALFQRLRFMEENAPELVDEAKISIITHFFHHMMSFTYLDLRSRKVRKKYFAHFAELLCQQPKDMLKPYCRLSYRKSLKVHMCRLIGGFSPTCLFHGFGIVQRIVRPQIITLEETEKSLL